MENMVITINRLLLFIFFKLGCAVRTKNSRRGYPTEWENHYLSLHSPVAQKGPTDNQKTKNKNKMNCKNNGPIIDAPAQYRTIAPVAAKI